MLRKDGGTRCADLPVGGGWVCRERSEPSPRLEMNFLRTVSAAVVVVGVSSDHDSHSPITYRIITHTRTMLAIHIIMMHIIHMIAFLSARAHTMLVSLRISRAGMKCKTRVCRDGVVQYSNLLR